jgi:hypothetical protein
MRLLQRILIAAVTTTTIIVSAGAAMASDYSGSWPVTVSHSQHSNGTYCLTLTENGRNGGSASLIIGSRKFPDGSFLVVNHTLVATVTAQVTAKTPDWYSSDRPAAATSARASSRTSTAVPILTRAHWRSA